MRAALARWALPLSMFLGSFAWSFVYVSLPFYIEGLSKLDRAATLRWTGWILGISPLITVVTAPISGRLAGQRDPKRAFVWTQGLQGAGFVLMALARTLPEMFLARLLLGAMGAVSTFAFIMAGRSGGDVRREVSEIQLGMTLGQVLGPAVGALTAARIGIRMSFLLSAGMLGICALLVGRMVPAGGGRVAARPRAGTASIREISTVCLLVLGCLTQVFFLAAILPYVLPRLGVSRAAMLEVGGVVLLTDGLAMALGSMAAPRVAEAAGDRRAVPWLLTCSSVCLAALTAAPNVPAFIAVRFVQVLCIAPVFPLAVGAIAHRSSGEVIGFLNSARIGASFVGPVFATTLLAWAGPSSVELALAAIGLGLVPVMVAATRASRPRGMVA